jgi:glc operon protein GlcG
VTFRTLVVVAAALVLGVASPALSQQAAPPPYGPPITLEVAKRAMAAAEAHAERNKYDVAITIIDSGGNMVMMHKADNTQLSSIPTSQGKAITALSFKRTSKALEDAVAAGGAGLRFLTMKDVTPIEGGVLIMQDGKITGAIGVSGTLGTQNAAVAQAGADAVK